jgi:RAD50-interacting protein 1
MEIQVAIFDKYHERLYNGLEAYLALNSTIGRSMPGVVAAEQTDIKGIHGLERLCRIYGSADYLERAMRDWSDDVFFLELWEELQYRANSGSRSESVFSPTHPKHTISDLSSRTSSNLGDGSSSGGALFDETASAYNRLRSRTEDKIVETLKHQLKEALRPYTRTNGWSSIPSASSPSSNAQIAASAELDAFFRTANENLAFLKRALAPVPLRRITHSALREVQNELWYGVLLKYSFSSAGAAQLQADIGTICGIFNQLVGKGVGASGLSKLIEGTRLLGLPPRGTSKGRAEEESAAEEGADADASRLSLWEVEKKLFADNESARGVLDELGLELLTENEARQVLGRRVELSS